MKILLINSHHKIIGGAERYYFDLAKLLEEKGHHIAFFSMQDAKNIKTKWSKYFLTRVNFSKNNLSGFIKKLFRMFYSIEAKDKISRILDDFKPDVVHINNIYYYISPSILGEIKKRNIPIVQTVHDYQLITPSITFFHDGHVCEITKANNFYKTILHRCVKKSYIASLMAVITSYIQYFLDYQKYINLFITPSIFMKNKLIEYGIDKKKIVQLNNFVDIPNKMTMTKKKEKYVLYFGRIEEAKGVNLILEVAEMLPSINFKIAGNFDSIKDKVKILSRIKTKKIKNIVIIKFQTKIKLKKLINNSEFVIVPSIWYENQPYSILESFALGKAVIGSNIGGIPEIIKNNHNGLLFDPSNITDFKDKILKLWNNPNLTVKLGQNGQKTILTRFNKESHYKILEKHYHKL